MPRLPPSDEEERNFREKIKEIRDWTTVQICQNTVKIYYQNEEICSCELDSLLISAISKFPGVMSSLHNSIISDVVYSKTLGYKVNITETDITKLMFQCAKKNYFFHRNAIRQINEVFDKFYKKTLSLNDIKNCSILIDEIMEEESWLDFGNALKYRREKIPLSIKSLNERFGKEISAGNFNMSDLRTADPKLYDALKKWQARGGNLDAHIPPTKGTRGPRVKDENVDLSMLNPSDPRDHAYIQVINRRKYQRELMRKRRGSPSPS